MDLIISSIYSWLHNNANEIIISGVGGAFILVIIKFYKTIARFLKNLIKNINNFFHRRSKIKKISEQNPIVAGDSEQAIAIVTNKLPIDPYPTTTFFHYRLTDAFPRLENGITEFNDRWTIIKRLKILLGEPLTFSTDDSRPGFDSHPIWWFRGMYNLWIDRFIVLDRRKVLINIDEYLVTKLIVYKSKHNYRDFIYVECAPDKPSGAYQHTKESIEREVNEYGFCQEEFGLHSKRIITRKEYDEGSTLIHNNPTSTTGAKLRSRVLTKYNFIIAAKHSPYNSNTFDRYSEEYFNNLLTNQIEFNEFLVWMQSLNRNPRDMDCD
ncbi:MAG: hypothetical protein PHY48_01615 [Candidatus Cloacimonetes bacterium]|nr:hypothetical protein [Candidatus Cloacimonadota bacterium]